MKIRLIIVLIPLFLSAAGQKITTTVVKDYGVLDYKKDVKVFSLHDSIPFSSEVIGKTEVAGSGPSKVCNLEPVIEAAQLEARKIGGNALKITYHLPPDEFRSCHRIKADILHIENLDSLETIQPKDTALVKKDYALLHVYRKGGVGALIGYDLYLGDSVICRVVNKWKTTLKIKKQGKQVLWARTEARSEVPIEIEPGGEYYLKCSITMGILVGHPKLELVDNQTGKADYQALKSNKTSAQDIITLKNGSKIECVITGEDEQNWYVEVLKGGKTVKTHVVKAQVATVEHGE